MTGPILVATSANTFFKSDLAGVSSKDHRCQLTSDARRKHRIVVIGLKKSTGGRASFAKDF